MRKAKVPEPSPVETLQVTADIEKPTRQKFDPDKPRKLRLEVVMDYRGVDYHHLIAVTGIGKNNYEKTIQFSESPAPAQSIWWNKFARALCVHENWLSLAGDKKFAPEWYESHKSSLLDTNAPWEKKLVAVWQETLDAKYNNPREKQISDWIKDNPTKAYLLQSFHRSIALDRTLNNFSIVQKSFLCSAWAIDGPTAQEAAELFKMKNSSRIIIDWNRVVRNKYAHGLSSRFLLPPGPCFQFKHAEHPVQYTAPLRLAELSLGQMNSETMTLSMSHIPIKHCNVFDAVVRFADDGVRKIVDEFTKSLSKDLADPLATMLKLRVDAFNSVFHDDPEMNLSEVLSVHRIWRRGSLKASEQNASLFKLAENIRAKAGGLSVHDALQIGKIYDESTLIGVLRDATSGKAHVVKDLIADLISRRKLHSVDNGPWYLYRGNESLEKIPPQ